jgi:large subunit ribosomal protein L23
MNNYFWIIKGIIETEKTHMLNGDNKYVFLINASANKIDVAKAVEYFYWVEVKWVNTVKIRKKTRPVWRSKIFTKRHAWAKAIVTLKEWNKIDFTALTFKENKSEKK